MHTKILGILSFLVLAALVTGCKDNSVFPDEPYMEYRSYTLVPEDADPDLPANHALVDLYFTDGDGDIGVDLPDGQFNFYANVMEKYDTGYVFAYDFPGILRDLADPGQQNKALEGIISYKVALTEIETDTVRIDFELIDDAGNSTGIVESEDIFVDFP